MAVNKISLRENMNRYFSLDEIESLCFDLGVDFENIGGNSKPGKVLELIQYMERRGRLEELAGACAKLRPNVDWGVGGTPTSSDIVNTRQVREEETPPPKQLKEIKARYALVVGINKFVEPAYAPLRFCVSDAKALAEALRKQDYTVSCMTDDLDRDDSLYPNRDNVEAELIRLARATDLEDMLLVHFSCHGTLVESKPYLILTNTRDVTVQRTGMAVADIEKYMREGKTQRRVVFLDACHMGVLAGRSTIDPEFIRNVHDLAWGSAMLAASTSQQVALEMANQPHGVFTYYLLQGLGGKAANEAKLITVDSLKTYVLDQVKRWSIDQKVQLQLPTYKSDGMGDMILARL